ncbi:MAG: PKD domain-containing protein [Gammaproteobacteria bacterium]|nr:PKD domain-containing protein [Gammaproteobacteria bacterium]
MRFYFPKLITISPILLLSSCLNEFPLDNQAPVVHAGTDQNIATGSLVKLDGSLSVDPEGSRITYSWKFVDVPENSAATLSNPTTVAPSFIADLDGVYRVSLVVHDELDKFADDEVVIVASTKNSAPVANAGRDSSAKPGDKVTLDGSLSSDFDSDMLTYLWTLVAPDGSSASLSDATAARPSFVADVVGVYRATLVVNDGNLESAADEVLVSVAFQAVPIAHAGENQTAILGRLVTLDGSASSDANNDFITYSWYVVSVPASSNVISLNNAATVSPSFTPDVEGTYIFSLTVNDGTDNSSPATVSVLAAVDAPPVSSAGSSKYVTTGSVVTLDGSASYDPNGQLLSYTWTTVSLPTGSISTLSSNSVVSPSFTADVDGDYVFSLVVSDGQLQSSSSTVTITAGAPNSPPNAHAGPRRSLIVGNAAYLNASLSIDPDGSPITYLWSIVSVPVGSSVTALSDPTVVNPTFVADVEGYYVISLVVNDGYFSSSPATVTISAGANMPPVAHAGYDRSVLTGSLVGLDGSLSTDKDGSISTYSWNIVSVPTGSTLSMLNEPLSRIPSFTPDVDGSYVISLSVSDGVLTSLLSQVVITAAQNVPPVADAGRDQTVLSGSYVELSGVASKDNNGDNLSYSWSINSVPATSGLSLLDTPTSVSSGFVADVDGSYVINLVVNDGVSDSAVDTVIITAGSGNVAPVAYAGADHAVAVGSSPFVFGYQSYDVNYDALNYNWTLISSPAGSNATIVDPGAKYFQFQADLIGDYVFSLIVNDGTLSSQTDTVTITAVTPQVVAYDTEDFPLRGSIGVNYGLFEITGLSSGVTYRATISNTTASSISLSLYSEGSFSGTYCFTHFECDLTASGSSMFLLVDTLYSDNGGEFSITIEPAPSPIVMDLSEFPDTSGSAHKGKVYYEVTGLAIGTAYYFNLASMTDSGTYLSVYSDADYSSVLCEPYYFGTGDDCVAVAQSTSAYIVVDASISYSGSDFVLEILEFSVTPQALSLSTPFDDTIVKDEYRYYRVDGLIAGGLYSIEVSNQTDDVDVWVYDDDNYARTVCDVAYAGTWNDSCIASSSGSSLYIRVDEKNSFSDSANFTLTVNPL